MSKDIEQILENQIVYYQQRASEYDEWFFRQGRYDRGPENNAVWFSDLDRVKRSLVSMGPLGNVLEIAGGTGLWTSILKEQSDSVHVLDSSEEVLNLNKMKNGEEKITYEIGNVFTWSPPRKFDFVFFSFWLSHVPENEFVNFWKLVSSCLSERGRWFFIDSQPDDFSRAIDHTFDHESDIVTRKLNDGTEFNIIKRFYNVFDLSKKLKTMGWATELSVTSRFFIYGSGKIHY